MTAAWTTVAALALGTALIKAIGPSLLARRELPAKATSVMTLLPAAVLAALIVTDTFGAAAGNLTLDARAAGLVAAVIAIALRLPMLAVLVTAAAVTALVRLLVC